MKKTVYIFVSLLSIITLIIQGKIIYSISKEITNSESQYEKEFLNVTSDKSQKKSEGINSILETIYINNEACEIVNLTFDNNSDSMEIEIHVVGTVEEVEALVDNIKISENFKEVKKYAEDESGVKKVYITFNISS